MNKASVFVQGDAFNAVTRMCFTEHGEAKYKLAPSLEDADIVVWTGGDDICPEIYGEKAIAGTYFNRRRDIDDLEAVKTATKMNKFLVGVCRGAQLLNCVPNGGKLWQDVDGHGSNLHRAFDCVTGKYVTVNSVHHQMMIPGEGAEMICWATESTIRKSPNYIWHKQRYHTNAVILEKDKDPEALWYPKTDSLLVQFHPEFGHPETTRYFFSLMDAYYWGKQERIAA